MFRKYLCRDWLLKSLPRTVRFMGLCWVSYTNSYTFSFPKINCYSFLYFPSFFVFNSSPLLLLLFFFNMHVILLFAKKTAKFQEGIPNFQWGIYLTSEAWLLLVLQSEFWFLSHRFLPAYVKHCSSVLEKLGLRRYVLLLNESDLYSTPHWT